LQWGTRTADTRTHCFYGGNDKALSAQAGASASERFGLTFDHDQAKGLRPIDRKKQGRSVDHKRRMDAIVTHAVHAMTSYSDDCGREASGGASD
jgi:hypothetical protein